MFTHDLKDYTRDFSLLDTYTRQMSIGLSRLGGMDESAALEFMNEIVEKNQDRINGTSVKFTMRKDNGDREVREVPILEYLRRIEESRLGMSPTLTTYKRPDQEVSLIVEDIANNMAKRKVVKREGVLAKQAGDKVLTTIKNGGQNAIKVLINSWSGATLDKHNPFNCQSTHPTLTTMCRISTALATASVEKFNAGKRYYHKPEKVIEDILAVLDKMDRPATINAINEYGLYIPTIDDIMAMITRSTNYYWWDAGQSEYISTLVSKLSKIERVALMYDGDFYHLYKHNKPFVDELLTTLSTTIFEEKSRDERFKEMDGDISTLVSNLMGNEIKGNVLWDYLDPEKHPEDNPIRKQAAAIADNLLNGLDKYKSLITTFFRVNHFPIDVGAQNHAIRLTVPLGDTDSTIFTTKHINEMYYGKVSFDESQEPVSDVIVYMVNGIIAHALANFTAQMGVVEDRRNLLIMKNEFKFPSLMLTPVAKTYHAYMKAQEGLVFSKPDFEMKGARNHAGSNNQTIVKELHKLMNDNLTNLNKGQLINRGELIDIMLRIEEDLRSSASRKTDLYFKRVRVRPEEEYKKPDASVSVYRTLWNYLFGKEYDEAPETQYISYKVDLNFENGNQEFLDALTQEQRDGLEAWRNRHNKKSTLVPETILVPVDCLQKFGIPKVLIPFVDVGKVAAFTLDPHRLNLGAMGIMTDKGENGVMLHDIMEGY